MDTVEDAESIKCVMKSIEEESSVNEVKSGITPFNHQELVKLTKTTIGNVINSDPLLSGLPSDVTIEELKSYIAVAQGQAITLFLNRGELPKLSVMVIYFYF